MQAATKENLVECASIQTYRIIGTNVSRFRASVYVADTESAETLSCETAEFSTEDEARTFIAQEGFAGDVRFHSPLVKDGNVLRCQISLFSYGRDSDGFYITQGVGNYGRREFQSAAELAEYLDTHLFEWPARKDEILSKVGESSVEDARFMLNKLDVFSLRSRAIEAGGAPAKTATRSHLIDLILCASFPAYADQIRAEAVQAQQLQNRQRADWLASVISKVKAGLQFPRIKVDQTFWYLDPVAKQVVKQGAVEHRRAIFDLEDRFQSEVVNLDSREDFDIVVAAILPNASAE